MAQAEAQLERLRNVFRAPSEAGGDWNALVAALEDDFNTPAALAVLNGWRDHELLRRGLDLFGLGSLAADEAAPPEVISLAEKREAARAKRDFAAADELRGQIEAAGWEIRDVAEGFQLVPR